MSSENLQDRFTNPEMNNTCLQHIIAQNAEILKVLLQLVQTLASNQLNSCCCGRAQSEAPLKSASLEPPSVNYNIANPQRPDQRPIPQQKFVRPLNGEWPSTIKWFNSNKFHNQGFQHKFCGYCKRVGHTMGQCRFRPLCQYCGKRGHTFEECYEAKNQCLYCQQQGHVVQNCPVKNNLKVGCPFCDEQHLGKDCQTKTKMELACSVVEDCSSKPESLPINETSGRTQGVEEPLEKHWDQPSVDLGKRLPHLLEPAENESKLITQDAKNLSQADLLGEKTNGINQQMTNDGITKTSVDLPIDLTDIKDQPVVDAVKERYQFKESPWENEKSSNLERLPQPLSVKQKEQYEDMVDFLVKWKNQVDVSKEVVSFVDDVSILKWNTTYPHEPRPLPVKIGGSLDLSKLGFFPDQDAWGSFIKASHYTKLNPQKFPLRQLTHIKGVKRGDTVYPVMGEVILSLVFASGFHLEHQKFIVVPDDVSDYDLIMGPRMLRRNQLWFDIDGSLLAYDKYEPRIVAKVSERFKLFPPV